MAAILDARLVTDSRFSQPQGPGIAELIKNSPIGDLVGKIGDLWKSHKEKQAAQIVKKERMEKVTQELTNFLRKNPCTNAPIHMIDLMFVESQIGPEPKETTKQFKWAERRQSIHQEFRHTEWNVMVNEAIKRIS